MKTDVIERYIDAMPEEAVDSMIALSSKQRWAVLLALIIKERMYFNEIKDEFGAAPEQVDRILKHLVAGGFVSRRVGNLGDIGDRGKTFYTPTPLARSVIKEVADAFLPPEPVILPSSAPPFAMTSSRTFPRTYSGTSLPMIIGIDAGPVKGACGTWRQRQTPKTSE